MFGVGLRVGGMRCRGKRNSAGRESATWSSQSWTCAEDMREESVGRGDAAAGI
jgi:hypothetical protein